MRKSLAILLTLLTLLCLTACGGGNNESAAPTEEIAGSDVGEAAQPEGQEPSDLALQEDGATEPSACFTESDGRTIIAPDGTEYKFLGNEGVPFHYIGELEFVAYVEGEPTELHHLNGTVQTGMYSIKGDPTDHLLIRIRPDSEWYAIYRKASLPDFDYSIDNCSRLEFIPIEDEWGLGEKHGGCGYGITDPKEIAAFLSAERAQKSANEAGLFELVKQPNGRLLNCYWIGYVCAFFEEEPNLIIVMEVTSYNDQAYSVRLDEVDRVLPEEWLPRLMNSWDRMMFLLGRTWEAYPNLSVTVVTQVTQSQGG